MAQDALLGKKLVIALTDEKGAALTKSPEILKWSVEEITAEEKKSPIGEEEEYRQVIQNGFKGTLEGQAINTAMDDIVDAKIAHQQANGSTLSFVIFTTETYRDGTVRKYKYENVTFDGYKRSADGNNKPITNNLNWHSTGRIKQ
ncbi:hypothetical protein [Bacillus sp. 3255]|uniref:hypothetical protein n=1 Tax=Bacillus sp. 3255 TaxID=2817904 RepID=UPI002861C327|nr:hypothetical protein [Bacillus sp. 3255]MDR6883022.1 hypothetical protein [Bacillus sp. 3255]